MSAGVKVVPWVDWAEWTELRSRIAAGDHAAAGATLALYRLRRPGSLPLAVQSTAELAMLLDFNTPQEPHARRLALSMAVVRLVNGATDRIQPRADGAAARSVHSLAKALRLPPILVELRHQAAHNALPRLDALVDAGHEAMAWLEAEYWQPQAAAAAKHLDLDNDAVQGHGGRPSNSTDDDEYSGRGACGRELAVSSTGDPLSLPRGGPSSKRPRDRWQRCENPSEWSCVPIGMIPGQAKVRSLMGIDVGSVIGRNWRPTASNECAPVAKARRVLSDAEKSTVEQMMRKILFSKTASGKEMTTDDSQ
jgi:hypothetical protein